ncbi:MAG: hypothetical protein F2583_04030 [Actinobacteria bacterium]|uniref:Unannotated protein n=1 Tax=freshwater metagenome TaxID=449393 RepID=A0A6J6GTA0_9ZZZZ|nr:hypothetical protein [Actinomycetota bacterium]
MQGFRRIVFLTVAVFLFASFRANAAQDPGTSLTDDKKGHQIQVVYVETQSSAGSNYHTNGRVKQYISQIQSWLKTKTGKELIFDTYQGQLDIAYLKYEGNIDMKNDEDLVRMYQKLNPTNYLGKSLIFVIDQKLATDTGCGWSQVGSGWSLALPNWPGCMDEDEPGIAEFLGLNSIAHVIVHEIFHSYGVKHACDSTTTNDLMHGEPECAAAGIVKDYAEKTTFDKSGLNYWGGNKAGVDLKTLRIWSDGSGTTEFAIPANLQIVPLVTTPTTVAPTNQTINCTKGKVSKLISAKNPKCPKGFKIKI